MIAAGEAAPLGTTGLLTLTHGYTTEIFWREPPAQDLQFPTIILGSTHLGSLDGAIPVYTEDYLGDIEELLDSRSTCPHSTDAVGHFLLSNKIGDLIVGLAEIVEAVVGDSSCVSTLKLFHTLLAF